MKPHLIVTTALFGLALSAASLGQQQNDVKGQDQLSGANGSFGTVYSLKNKFNLEIYSAKYTMEPMVRYFGATYAKTKEKLLIFQIGIKNATGVTNNFSADFKIVDSNQHIYDPDGIQVQSNGTKEWDPRLNPGQGMGQPELKDPVRVAFEVPEDAVIDKLMVRPGRLNTSEEVLRYALVPKASATNKNVIAPLPAEVRDPSDPNGQLALPIGQAKIGQYYPSNIGEVKVVDISAPDGAVFGMKPPPADKKFVVVKLTITDPTEATFNTGMYTSDTYKLVDTDGDTYSAWGFRKASADEDVDRKLEKGDEFTIRMFFAVPKTVSLKQLNFGFFDGRIWAVSLAGLSL